MASLENDLDIYYPVGNTNTQRQENEITGIKKNVILKIGSWSQQALRYLILKNSFQSFIYLGKEIVNNIVGNLYLFQVRYTNQKLFTR